MCVSPQQERETTIPSFRTFSFYFYGHCVKWREADNGRHRCHWPEEVQQEREEREREVKEGYVGALYTTVQLPAVFSSDTGRRAS